MYSLPSFDALLRFVGEKLKTRSKLPWTSTQHSSYAKIGSRAKNIDKATSDSVPITIGIQK